MLFNILNFITSNLSFFTGSYSVNVFPSPLEKEEEEKLYIAENYLIPSILKKHGLKNNVIKFEIETIRKIISNYTSESGVRELERCINKIIRKVITEHIKSSRKIVSVRIHDEDLIKYLDQ